jgi:hypothetical protein
MTGLPLILKRRAGCAEKRDSEESVFILILLFDIYIVKKDVITKNVFCFVPLILSESLILAQDERWRCG